MSARVLKSKAYVQPLLFAIAFLFGGPRESHAFMLSRAATSGGGSTGTGGSYSMRSTIGEAGIVSRVMARGGYALGMGFWPGYTQQSAAATDDALADGPTYQNALLSTYPNPFGGKLLIGYSVSAPAEVSVHLCDVAGREIAFLGIGRRPAGTHTVSWDGRCAGGLEAPAGVYFCRLTIDGWSTSRQVIKLR